MELLKHAQSATQLQAEYDRIFREDPIRDEVQGYRWIAEKVVQQGRGARQFLDVACGGGFFLRELKKILGARAQAAGLDLSVEALRLARKQCPQASFLAAVAEKLPFRDHCFDALTCLGSLEHFLDIEGAIQEIRRVTRPGSLIAILVPNVFWYKDILAALWTGDRKPRNQSQERFATFLEWKTLFESGGLAVERALKYNGISRHAFKQWLKDKLVPRSLSYHFLFLCRNAP